MAEKCKERSHIRVRPVPVGDGKVYGAVFDPAARCRNHPEQVGAVVILRNARPRMQLVKGEEAWLADQLRQVDGACTIDHKVAGDWTGTKLTPGDSQRAALADALDRAAVA